MDAFRKEVEGDPHVVLIGHQDGVVVVPAKDGQPITKEVYAGLPVEVRASIDERVREASKGLFLAQRRMLELRTEAESLAEDLHRQVTRSVVSHRFSILKDLNQGSPTVLKHLDAMAADIVENWEKFATSVKEEGDPASSVLGQPVEDFFVRYRVNPIVTPDRNAGAPVVM